MTKLIARIPAALHCCLCASLAALNASESIRQVASAAVAAANEASKLLICIAIVATCFGLPTMCTARTLPSSFRMNDAASPSAAASVSAAWDDCWTVWQFHEAMCEAREHRCQRATIVFITLSPFRIFDRASSPLVCTHTAVTIKHQRGQKGVEHRCG